MPPILDTNDLFDEVFHSTVRVEKIYALVNTVHHEYGDLDEEWKNLLEDPSDEVIAILTDKFGIAREVIEQSFNTKRGASIVAEYIMHAALKKNLTGYIIGYDRPIPISPDGTHNGFGRTRTNYFYAKEINNRTMQQMVLLARRHFNREKRELGRKEKEPAAA